MREWGKRNTAPINPKFDQLCLGNEAKSLRYCNAELTQEYPSCVHAEVKPVWCSKGVPARRSN